MHITWHEIYAGLYEGLLFDGKTVINHIQFTDYSRKEQIAYDIKHKIKRKGAYDVRYIGTDDVIRHFIFDSTEDKTKYGYNETPKRTIETMKEWCENFMKSIGIEQYVEDCSTTPEARWIRKENIDSYWFICSNCGKESGLSPKCPKYCPNCHKRMDI